MLRTIRRFGFHAPGLLLLIAGLLILPSPTAIGQGFDALVPPEVTLGEPATRAIAAPWLTDDERSALRVFHGVWDQRDLDTLSNRAMASLLSYDLGHQALADERVSIALRAEAMALRGELRASVDLLADADDFASMRVRAEALHELGQFADAAGVARQVSAKLTRAATEDAAELTDGIRTLLIGAAAEGQPARDFQLVMQMFSRAHQQLDRLYWPAKLAEAQLLLDKDNTGEAVTALHEVLRLNPRCSAAWYALGRIALRQFDFDSAALAANILRTINPEHPLTNLLLAESRLIEDDPDGALELLEPVLNRWPTQRRALALQAAGHALTWDQPATQAALDRYDELSPGSARAYYTTGKQLSFNRQYEWAADMLAEAVRREPRWPAPQIELGLMELQSGRDHIALDVLRDVTELDPFNKRAANSLFLLEELTTYTRVETEHFVLRYKPGIDQVMVDMMPERLEEIHKTVYDRFGWDLDRKTIIELLPNHQRFAVRITGMPSVHTIAACTGPVLAMEVPRQGRQSEHFGIFDWPRVFRHEYTHTMTLAQTHNRIPHWLTEAAAVDMELAPRTYARATMLAKAYLDDTLFNLYEIKWAFVRPRKAGDRSKAYAQSHWMIEYMDETFGNSAIVQLLAAYFAGDREEAAIPKALGVSREEFFAGFHAWAGGQVKQWGLAPSPSMEELLDEVRLEQPELAIQMIASATARLSVIVKTMTHQIGQPRGLLDEPLSAAQWPPLVRPQVQVTDAMLITWLDQHPDHPDLWELRIRRRLAHDDTIDEQMIEWLERYTELRPVDPFPHKKLAQHWLGSDTPQQAIEHLEYLDVREEYTAVYALELAKQYRAAGRMDEALSKATRALNINPYDAPSRELAAAIAIESRDLPTARLHIKALTLLEPDRPQHQRRLERIDELLGVQP